MANIFFDIGLVIIVGTVLCLLARLFKQPLIPAYIIAGVLIGPVFGFITDIDTIILLAEIGIAFLLFIVGLEIDLRKLRTVALVSIVGGSIKIVILFILGFIIAIFFGLVPLQAGYIGLILAFSSTMVVLKLLSDRKELDTLHGRIVIGTLVLEDVIAIFALTLLSSLDGFSSAMIGLGIVKGAALLVVAVALSKYVFPKLFNWAAENQEVLLLLSLSVMFAFSLIFHWLGFSIAIGAFIAGVALGNLFCSVEVMVRVKPLRDFFATIFFVALGMEILISAISQHWLLIVILTLIAIILKPVIVMTLTSMFGYKKRPAYQSAIVLGQISEFGLIIATTGLILGHIGQDLFSVTVVVAVLTIAWTSYALQYEKKLYQIFRRQLRWFEKLNFAENQLGYLPKKRLKYEVVLCGHNRIGYSIVEKFKHKKNKMLVIDFNPEVIAMMTRQKIPCLYGDISDPELIDRVNFKAANLVISTVPDVHTNVMLVHRIKKQNKRAAVFVTTADVKDALHLYGQGADYVIMPHFLGGSHVSLMLRGFKTNVRSILKNKLFHIQELQHRHNLGHKHPKPNR